MVCLFRYYCIFVRVIITSYQIQFWFQFPQNAITAEKENLLMFFELFDSPKTSMLLKNGIETVLKLDVMSSDTMVCVMITWNYK